MNVLVLGSGGAGRQDAICWALHKSMGVDDRLYVAPGNPGTARWATNLEVNPLDNVAVLKLVRDRDYEINLVVVGPEAPLENGVVDYLNEHAPDVLVFGPTQAAARLETSKREAIEIMAIAKVPHPASEFFENPEAVKTYVAAHPGKTFVIKADYLAQGKGVHIGETPDKAKEAAEHIKKGNLQRSIVVQEFLTGIEVSVFGFVDRRNVSRLIAACDYKKLHGKNTGGMGAYARASFWTRRLEAYVRQYIMLPIVREMEGRGTPYCGVLYAGLMILPDGTVKVLEFNCRLGDPEAQVILPRFRGNFLRTLVSCANGDLLTVPMSWKRRGVTVGVVIASEGYPDAPKIDRLIDGIEEAEKLGCIVFHGATERTNAGIVTTGGRPLTVVADALTVEQARELAYKACSKIQLKGKQTIDSVGL
ncbi:MAG: phosphoribosylamine--glycine ligase [Candidatus Wildermuthbacteria bacterium RIFCSPHIGHO2_01_FULL_48_25]|nr:MAG: phosphoribosylamine--glycine ligase [Candidatus Wildermuthbacteria bacterium RIFCSPHIGHO2_01_FULL_48_25]OHA68127.1 MAG: phosphoribosylamine--glycine ligase [Candidatus Wildermuthbacteria bacterium RIFCSPHIGHO2_02_FULL_49_12b]